MSKLQNLVNLRNAYYNLNTSNMTEEDKVVLGLKIDRVEAAIFTEESKVRTNFRVADYPELEAVLNEEGEKVCLQQS
jgi:hypothetical protein